MIKTERGMPNIILEENNLKLKIDLTEQNSIINENSINNEYSIDYTQEDFINKNFIDLSFLESEENTNNNINNNQLCTFINSTKNNQLYSTIMQNNFFNNMYFYHQFNCINNKKLNIMNQNMARNNKIFTKKRIDEKYLINIMDIKTNKEKRTTIRMMNIPSYFKPLDLMKKIDEKFGISPQKENRIYNFIYIPLKENNKNAGYAFINFVHPKHIIKFCFYFNGKKLKLKTSKKICIITFADKQGAYVKHKGLRDDINDNFLFFNDTKNHLQLLTE